MIDHALYYPEWSIRDPLFLAESLLYWDRIACIVPFEGFRDSPWNEDEELRKVMAEAHEQYVVPVLPTDEQKQRAHKCIEAFASTEAPEWCRPDNLAPQHRQMFSAEKVSYETLRLLQESGWARPLQRANNLELQLIHDAAADLVLGALAEACSSPSMPPVTDDPGSFTANCNLLLRELGAPTGITTKQGRDGQVAPIESDYAFLLTKVPHFSLRPEDVNARTLRRILDARNDVGLDEQRKNFQQKLDDYLQRMRTTEQPERQLVVAEFGGELTQDQGRLQRELRRAGLEMIFSKEGVVAVIVGMAAGAISPGIGLAIGLAGQIVSYRHKREEAFNKHWSSWIFSATASRLTVW